MTQFEKIKKKSKWEMLKFLIRHMDCEICPCECKSIGDCKENLEKWLESEVKTDE
jgi:hypothetical protein